MNRLILSYMLLTLFLLNLDLSCFENTVDPDQMASDEASWSGRKVIKLKSKLLLKTKIQKSKEVILL